MQAVSVDELINHKILPYNLFNESGDKIMLVGDVLTPGKLLQLRYLSVIFRDGDTETNPPEDTEIEPLQKVEEKEEKPAEISNVQDKIVNIKSEVPAYAQVNLKTLYNQALNSVKEKANEQSVELFKDIRNKVLEDILPVIHKINHKSQLKMIGEYDVYHGLNVSILSTVLAKKLGFSREAISEVALASLLHDIGKTRLSKEVLDFADLNAKNLKLFQMHPQIGYKILKNEMNMPETICKVALEHHEKNDGSGYPYGISGGMISQIAQIVSVCNFYDVLISGKGTTYIKTPKEAVKHIMEAGTACFSPDILYTFVHMTNFNDTTPVEELGAEIQPY